MSDLTARTWERPCTCDTYGSRNGYCTWALCRCWHHDDLTLTPRRTDMTLYDADTDNPIGPATREQAAASYADDNDDNGAILIDAQGNVVRPGTWDADQPEVRKVYVGR
jgi:hypothetical protein